jgi:hypothetical protein
LVEGVGEDQVAERDREVVGVVSGEEVEPGEVVLAGVVEPVPEAALAVDLA